MKLNVTITPTDGSKEKSVDVYGDEIQGLMNVILRMASKDPNAPVALTITRKDILKRYLQNVESE